MPKPPKSRSRSPAHPGVTYTKLDPHPASGFPRWLVRWRDPLTGKSDSKTLCSPRLTKTHVAEWCVAKSRANHTARADATLAYGRAEVLGVDPVTVGDDRDTVESACVIYYQSIAAAKHRSRSTLRGWHECLMMFVGWCRARGVVYTDTLTTKLLAEYRRALIARRMPDGTPYKMSTINFQMRPVRAALNMAIADERAPQSLAHGTKNGLKHTTIKRRDRKKYDIGGAFRLDVHEIKALIMAALAFDVRHRPSLVEARYPRPNVAIDIAMLILWGMRIDEYAQTKCEHARSHDAEVFEIFVSGKGGADRGVFARGYTDIGVELVRELKVGRAPGDWLSEMTYGQMQNVWDQLVPYGAPVDCSAHDMRATTATYQTALLGYDPNRAADRLGHGLVVATGYVKAPDGMIYGAPSLEVAMQCEVEFRMVLDAYRMWRDTWDRPRPSVVRGQPTRTPKPLSNTQALLSGDARLIADALQPHPARVRKTTPLPVPVRVTT